MQQYNPFEEVAEDILVLPSSPFSLILHNDDFNTFDWVIACLVNFCEHQPLQAEQCALIVHNNGKCEVKRGTEETIKEMYAMLQSADLTVSINSLAE